MRALLLDGSPASPSRVGVLLDTIASRLNDRDCEVQVLQLQTAQLPLNDPAYHTNPDNHPSDAVRDFVRAVRGADIIVLGTPLYHGSFSGLLKMALDHLDDDAFADKIIGLVSNSSNVRNSPQGAHELMLVVRTMKGEVLNRLIGTCQTDYGVKEGIFQVTEDSILNRIGLFTDELVAKAAAHR